MLLIVYGIPRFAGQQELSIGVSVVPNALVFSNCAFPKFSDQGLDQYISSLDMDYETPPIDSKPGLK